MKFDRVEELLISISCTADQESHFQRVPATSRRSSSTRRQPEGPLSRRGQQQQQVGAACLIAPSLLPGRRIYDVFAGRACCALALHPLIVVIFREQMIFWVLNKWGYNFRACLGQASVHPTQGHNKLKPRFPKGPSRNGPIGWGCIPMGNLVLFPNCST